MEDNKNCEKQNRLLIQFQKKNNVLPSSWEIGNFIDNFSNYYYKISLINTLADRISSKTNPSNIFILDESFKLNRSYNWLKDINIMNRNIVHLYTMGCPISLYPNKDIIKLNYIFKVFRRCNELLRLYKSRVLARNNINHFTGLIYEKKIKLEDILIKIIEMAAKNLSARNQDTYNKRIKSIRNIINQINLKYYYNLMDHSIDIKSIIHKLNQLNTLNEEDSLTDNEDLLIKKYFSQFFGILNSHTKPVICIYDSKTKNIEILGIGHINKQKREYDFIDVKNIGHNSPPIADIIVGLTNGACTLYTTVQDEKRKRELHELKLKKEKLHILQEKSKLYALHNGDIEDKIAKVDSEIESMEIINQLVEKENTNSVEQITNDYIRENSKQVYNACQERAKNIIYNNKYKVINMEVCNNNFDTKI